MTELEYKYEGGVILEICKFDNNNLSYIELKGIVEELGLDNVVDIDIATRTRAHNRITVVHEAIKLPPALIAPNIPLPSSLKTMASSCALSEILQAKGPKSETYPS